MIPVSQLVNISISLVGIQTGVFLILLVCAVYKIYVAYKQGNQFIITFFIVTLLYILCQLSIQIIQLVCLIKYQDPEKNCNITLSLNVFCMIADMHLLLMLTLYWKEIQGSFIESGVRYSHFINTSCLPYRLILPFLWFVCYVGYFIYLAVTNNLINSLELGDKNKIALYVAVQSVTMIMLLVCGIWQSYHWHKL